MYGISVTAQRPKVRQKALAFQALGEESYC